MMAYWNELIKAAELARFLKIVDVPESVPGYIVDQEGNDLPILIDAETHIAKEYDYDSLYTEKFTKSGLGDTIQNHMSFKSQLRELLTSLVSDYKKYFEPKKRNPIIVAAADGFDSWLQSDRSVKSVKEDHNTEIRFEQLFKSSEDHDFVIQLLQDMRMIDEKGQFILVDKKRSALFAVVTALRSSHIIPNNTDESLLRAFCNKVNTKYTRLKSDSKTFYDTEKTVTQYIQLYKSGK